MSERIYAKQTAPLGSAAQVANGLRATPRKPVRGRSSPLPGCSTAGSNLTRLAHPSNRLVAQLNERWRVINDPLQWTLQRKKGTPRKKNSGWTGRSFCRTREALLRCVREYCGEVDPPALEKLNEPPKWHLDWDHTNLDVPETNQAQADKQPESLASKESEALDAAD
jgi:hypothetical protein